MVAAAAPLGLGIGADMYVAVGRAISPDIGVAVALLLVAAFSILWFVQPLMLRSGAPLREH